MRVASTVVARARRNVKTTYVDPFYQLYAKILLNTLVPTSRQIGIELIKPVTDTIINEL
jgi:hypothetical protein